MKLPSAWVAASFGAPAVEPKTDKKEVTARIDMSAEVVGRGLCPECKHPMIRTIADGVPVMACVADRISLPIENTDAQDQGNPG